MTNHRFDLDIDPGPIETDYDPSGAMLSLIDSIAALEGLEFRFWCAKTLATNMSSVIPLADAEDVVLHVVAAALEQGAPTDGAYFVHVDRRQNLVAVQHDDDVFPPEEFDRVIFAAIDLPDEQARQIALRQLTLTTALDKDYDVLASALTMFKTWLQAVEAPVAVSPAC